VTPVSVFDMGGGAPGPVEQVVGPTPASPLDDESGIALRCMTNLVDVLGA
jgi:hypothetical protein